MGLVKICGLRSVTDVNLAERAGADELGLNFVPGRARCIALEQARGDGLGDGSVDGVARSVAYPGERVLFDAARGGSGIQFDWSWLQGAAGRPYLLAGGLGPDNVAAAIAQTDAAGVDVASGVEAEVGVKDPAKLVAFVTQARAAFAARSRC